MEHTDGSMASDWNGETGECTPEYYYYDINLWNDKTQTSCLIYTIIYDGNEYSGNSEDIYSITGEYPSCSFIDNQFYDTRWEPGHTYKCKATLSGLECEFDVYIDIEKIKTLNEDDVALPYISTAFTGSDLKPEPTVKYYGNILTKGVDYTVSYSNNINKGTAAVTVTGIGQYTGSVSKSFTINAKAVTPTVTLSAGSYTYDGTAKTPTVTVKAGSTVLKADTDYTVAFADGRINVGTYDVNVTLKGNYSGSARSKFTINAQTVTPTVTLSAGSYTYDGTAKTPTVTVKAGSTVLKADTDYTAAFADGRTNVGTYDVNVTLKGNYSGSAKASFSITAGNISSATVKLAKTSETYTGQPIKIDVSSVVAAGNTLKAGTDYDVSYSNNINAGKATVTITGKGGYTGKTSAEFEITQKSVAPVVKLSKSSFTYNGKTQKPKVTSVKDGTIKLTTADYDIVWPKAAKNAGTYTVQVNLKGNYTGSAKVQYKIVKATVTIKPADKTVKLSKVKKKAQTVKPITVKTDGAVTYTLKSVKLAKNKSTNITINKKTGKLTVKKGAEKGTYTVKVKVTAKVKKNYKKKLTKTVTFKITVK